MGFKGAELFHVTLELCVCVGGGGLVNEGADVPVLCQQQKFLV